MPPRTSTWTGDAEKDLIMALWYSNSDEQVKVDWPKAVSIMEAWGHAFTTDALKSRWSKTILKEYKTKRASAEAATAGSCGKRKRVDDENSPPPTPKRSSAAGLQTPTKVTKRAKPSGNFETIEPETVGVPVGPRYSQSPEPSPTTRIRRSNPSRSATKLESYKESSSGDDTLGSNSDVVA